MPGLDGQSARVLLPKVPVQANGDGTVTIAPSSTGTHSQARLNTEPNQLSHNASAPYSDQPTRHAPALGKGLTDLSAETPVQTNGSSMAQTWQPEGGTGTYSNATMSTDGNQDIRIRVKLNEKVAITINANKNDRISALKSKIGTETGVAEAQQRLKFRNAELADGGGALAQYDVKDGDTIELQIIPIGKGVKYE